MDLGFFPGKWTISIFSEKALIIFVSLLVSFRYLFLVIIKLNIENTQKYFISSQVEISLHLKPAELVTDLKITKGTGSISQIVTCNIFKFLNFPFDFSKLFNDPSFGTDLFKLTRF